MKIDAYTSSDKNVDQQGRTRCLSNPFAVNRTIISLFDVESQIVITMTRSASLWQISMTPLYYPPSKSHCLVQDSPLYLFYKPS